MMHIYGNRYYWYTYPIRQPKRVVVALHGWKQKIDDSWTLFKTKNFRKYSKLDKEANSNATAIIYPEAIKGNWIPFRDAKFIAELSSEIAHQCDVKNVHLVGFSDGATLCHSIINAYSELFTSCIVHSGVLPLGMKIINAKHKLPVMVVCGTQDNTPVKRWFKPIVDLYTNEQHHVTTLQPTIRHQWCMQCNTDFFEWMKGTENKQ